MSLGENVLAPKTRRGFSKIKRLSENQSRKNLFHNFAVNSDSLKKNLHLPHLVSIVYCSGSTTTTTATATTGASAARATITSVAATMASTTAVTIAGLKIMI